MKSNNNMQTLVLMKGYCCKLLPMNYQKNIVKLIGIFK